MPGFVALIPQPLNERTEESILCGVTLNEENIKVGMGRQIGPAIPTVGEDKSAIGHSTEPIREIGQTHVDDPARLQRM
jgi:hypothetical protein